MEELIDKFVDRLKVLNIEIDLVSNYPWIYLDKVNGNIVKEKQYSKYGYTIIFIPFKLGSKVKFINIKDMFKLIRKYK